MANIYLKEIIVEFKNEVVSKIEDGKDNFSKGQFETVEYILGDLFNRFNNCESVDEVVEVAELINDYLELNHDGGLDTDGVNIDSIIKLFTE